MRVFNCDHCQHLVFFENVFCVKCNQTLAYLPDLGVIGSLDPAGDGLYTSPIPRSNGQAYRLCQNYTEHNVCNWAVKAEDPDPLCLSCRITQVIPDITKPGQKEAWYKLEVAKRRLAYTLVNLGLPIVKRIHDPEHGLAFEFRADPEPGSDEPIVLTGHANGVITINTAEADDAEREKRRLALHEPYRTVLGHFRHEIGHYYWDRLIANTDRLDPFRERFGDERADYGEALKHHYDHGAPADWPSRFVTSYASAHPWEDWAETWAHYLHMVDTLETASACGVSLRPPRKGDPTLKAVADPLDADTFDCLMESWFPLTYMLNNLNRGLGMADAYPFVLSVPAVEKLRFVHETVRTFPGRATETRAESPFAWLWRLGGLVK